MLNLTAAYKRKLMAVIWEKVVCGKPEGSQCVSQVVCAGAHAVICTCAKETFQKRENKNKEIEPVALFVRCRDFNPNNAVKTPKGYARKI